MSQNQQGPADPRFAVWIGTTIVLFVAAIAIGFVLLPSAQRSSENLSLWGVICRAVGIPNSGGDASKQVVVGHPSSTVSWTTTTRQLLADGDATSGADHATTCGNCHGIDGISSDAAFPNLAGQSAASIYKQLQDFKSGARNTAVMGVYVDPLSQDEMIDLAAYYSSLPNPEVGASDAADLAYPAAARLVEFGDPMRGIAGCAACHNPQGLTQWAPQLEGQQRAYLVQQMQAFKAGSRQNDISKQMRSVARNLSDSEISMLAAYFSELAASRVR